MLVDTRPLQVHGLRGATNRIPAVAGMWIGALGCFLLLACNEPVAPRPGADRGLADTGSAVDAALLESGASDTGGELGGSSDWRGDTRGADRSLDAASGLEAGTIAGLVLQVTFDQAQLGLYSDADIKSGWKWIKWYSGLKEGRVEIIDGAQARQGRSLRILYPKGGVGPGQGGAQWWVTLPASYSELYCSYWVKFATGFDFVKGGKLPGLLGGAGNTGGDKPTGTDGWSARMMWQKLGAAVQYVYHPDQPTIYGESLPYNLGGQRSFTPGTWHRVEHRIVMNTPKLKDGVIQAWWDGQLALDRQNLRFRDVSTFAIDGFYFSTFFGGSDATWAPSKDEYVYFDDFVIATKPIAH